MELLIKLFVFILTKISNLLEEYRKPVHKQLNQLNEKLQNLKKDQ
jgi:hypothetical protein